MSDKNNRLIISLVKQTMKHFNNEPTSIMELMSIVVSFASSIAATGVSSQFGIKDDVVNSQEYKNVMHLIAEAVVGSLEITPDFIEKFNHREH